MKKKTKIDTNVDFEKDLLKSSANLLEAIFLSSAVPTNPKLVRRSIVGRLKGYQRITQLV